MASRKEDLVPDQRLEAQEPGYAEWKRAKIERALAQTKDRAAMIPAERIWRPAKNGVGTAWHSD